MGTVLHLRGARRLVIALLLAAAAISALTGASLATGASGPSLAVTAFQVEGDPTALIDRSAAAIRTVGVDGVELSLGGRTVPMPDARARIELARARIDRLRGELLISNYDERIQDFSEPVARQLLSSRPNVARAVARLARVVRQQGWDGVCVDIESLLPRDGSGLTRFLQALRWALPRQKAVSIAISNGTSAGEFAANGYQLRPIGRTADRVILMAYDQHGPWENTPGPVGALPWQRAGLGVLLRSVPASKVDLGVGGYGYAWRHHSNIQLSDAQARRLVADDGRTPRFDQAAGEWTATLHDGSVLWWSDARSYAERVALARSYGLHGLAVWSLGLSDPLAPS